MVELPAHGVERSALQYRLEQRLAVGGMAEIFSGRAVGAAGFERPVVVKRLLSSMARDPQAAQSIIDEARVQALIVHPSIPTVFELGICDERGPFIVMEHLEGIDLEGLHESLRRRGLRISLSHAIHIVDRVAAALHCAHELRGADGQPLGLIHRDVSPANIFIADDGEAKLLDFGVSKSLLSETLTQVGYVKGKAPYMSPEQCLQEPLDRRTDIFSLGIVLYELATGFTLFREAPDDVAAMEQILAGGYPRPSQREPELPPLLERVILRALAIEPEDRFATASDLREALADVTPQIRPEPLARLGVLVRQMRASRKRAATLSPTEPTVIAPLSDDQDEPAEGEDDGDETTVHRVSLADLEACREEYGDETVVTPPDGYAIIDEPTESYGPRERALAAAEKLARVHRVPNVDPPVVALASEQPLLPAAGGSRARGPIASALALSALVIAAALALWITNM